MTTNFKTEKWRKVKGEIWRRALKKKKKGELRETQKNEFE